MRPFGGRVLLSLYVGISVSKRAGVSRTYLPPFRREMEMFYLKTAVYTHHYILEGEGNQDKIFWGKIKKIPFFP